MSCDCAYVKGYYYLWQEYALNIELNLHWYSISVAAGTHKTAGSVLH